METGDSTTEVMARAAAPRGVEAKVEHILKLIASLRNMEGPKPSTTSVGTQHLLYAVERLESNIKPEVFVDQAMLPQHDVNTWWTTRIMHTRSSHHNSSCSAKEYLSITCCDTML